jgi:hypothetical protein
VTQHLQICFGLKYIFFAVVKTFAKISVLYLSSSDISFQQYFKELSIFATVLTYWNRSHKICFVG